jgi:hypothetical protein
MVRKNTAIVVGVLMAAAGFLPLFGGPGYEHALATGLVVPSAAAIATALELVQRPKIEPSAAFGRGVMNGLLFALVSLGTAVLHGLRAGICEWWGALASFFFTAGAGSILGGVWGALVGELARRRKRPRVYAVVGALAAPVACIGVSVWRFVTSPMVYAFDPFVGYFSGTLYDTVIDPGVALYTYRFGTLCTLAAAGLFASSFERHWMGGLRAIQAPRARLALCAAFALASLGITWRGADLGHWSTRASIARDLGGELHGARCDVIYPSTVALRDARLLLRDCEEQLASVERALGARGPERITAFFFRDAADKKRLMGAAETYIAKPWRREVYLQMSQYPHPVLGHEIAHVVAGGFGRGPLRIAGACGGLWPNPGLIEGTAVAASPDDDDLTDMQWARAMLDLGILPPMDRIFAMGFFAESSAKSYTLAGAFVRWIIDTRGTDVLRAWYGGGDIEELTGKTWRELDERFRAHLKTIVLGPEAQAYAKAKFARPSVFGRKCPHLVDGLRREADKCRDTQLAERAVELYDAALRRDDRDYGSIHGRALVWFRHLDPPRGISSLEALASAEQTPRTWRDRAEETLGDFAMLDGRYEDARARYAAVAARTLDEDMARTLEVKAIAATDPAARAAILPMLIGAKDRGSDLVVAAVELGAWRVSGSPLADYLIGRHLALRGWYAEAAKYLDASLAAAPPTPRVHREALRLRVVCACALGDGDAVRSLRPRLAPTFAGTAGGRLASVERFADRCARWIAR